MPNPKVIKEVRKVVPLPPVVRVEVEYFTDDPNPGSSSRRKVRLTDVVEQYSRPAMLLEVLAPDDGAQCITMDPSRTPLVLTISRNCGEALALALARFYDLPYTPPESPK